jgi:hypothetical protein
MASTGMAIMLKSLGLDPDELKRNVEDFMQHMKQQAERINANQAKLEANDARLEAKLDELQNLLAELVTAELGPRRPSTTEIFNNGERTGILITDEKFPQAMLDDVYEIKTTTAGGEPQASNFDAVHPIGGQDDGRRRSNNEE